MLSYAVICRWRFGWAERQNSQEVDVDIKLVRGAPDRATGSAKI